MASTNLCKYFSQYMNYIVPARTAPPVFSCPANKAHLKLINFRERKKEVQPK